MTGLASITESAIRVVMIDAPCGRGFIRHANAVSAPGISVSLPGRIGTVTKGPTSPGPYFLRAGRWPASDHCPPVLCRPGPSTWPATTPTRPPTRLRRFSASGSTANTSVPASSTNPTAWSGRTTPCPIRTQSGRSPPPSSATGTTRRRAPALTTRPSPVPNRTPSAGSGALCRGVRRTGLPTYLDVADTDAAVAATERAGGTGDTGGHRQPVRPVRGAGGCHPSRVCHHPDDRARPAGPVRLTSAADVGGGGRPWTVPAPEARGPE